MSECLMPLALKEPQAQQVERLTGLIDGLLADVRTEQAVARYYDHESDFAGHTFLDLVPNEPYAFCPPDL